MCQEDQEREREMYPERANWISRKNGSIVNQTFDGANSSIELNEGRLYQEVRETLNDRDAPPSHTVYTCGPNSR